MYRGKFELFTLSDKSASLAFPKVGYLLAMVVDVLLPDQARFSNVPQFTHSMALVWTINLRTNHLPLRGACNLHEAQESIWESYHASPCITVFWKKKISRGALSNWARWAHRLMDGEQTVSAIKKCLQQQNHVLCHYDDAKSFQK